MAGIHWLISGVGRSGTTMAYGALLAAARAQDPGTLGRYEPFLWGMPTWDKLPERFGLATLHTDAFNAHGIYAHSQSPLFLDATHPVLDSFIDETLPGDHSVVVKLIRGAGRLSAFLRRDPDLKIIHLIRNPLDVVNSALLYFSFFGDEFHSSDEPRFNEEAAARFGDLHRSTLELTEAGRSFEWWRLMNEAAFRSAEEFPERLKIVAYENLTADLPGVMAEIVEFLGGDPDLIDESRLTRTIGPVSAQPSLRVVDRDALIPHVDAYFNDQRLFGHMRSLADIPVTKARLLEKYAACGEGRAFTRPIDPGLAPTRVRSIAVKAHQDIEAARSAGESQVAVIASEISATVASVKGAVKGQFVSYIAKLEDAIARLSGQVAEVTKTSEKRDVGVAALAAEFKEKKEEIGTLKRQIDKRDLRIIELDAKLRDLQALRQLNDRLRDRVAGLQDEQASQKSAFEKLRFEKRDAEDKLRKTENRLRTVAGEREQYRLQLVELASVLAPRLSTVATLRPLRYVLRQRQRIKSGLVEVDPNGVPRPKTKL